MRRGSYVHGVDGSEPRRPGNLPPHLRLERRLGAGSSAAVWAARDRRSGRWVAVKVLEVPEGDRRAGAQLERVEREVRALARLDGHPAVAAIRALGVDHHETVWLVTDLVDGPNLAERVRAGAGLDAEECDRVFRAVLGALAGAHAVGVVHGDVSPANVVLGRSGPVLVDFGVGGLDLGRGDRARTPVAAAPERLRGGRPTAASDVYSAAATVRWATQPDAVVVLGLERVLQACVDPLPARRPTAAEALARLGSAVGRGGR